MSSFTSRSLKPLAVICLIVSLPLCAVGTNRIRNNGNAKNGGDIWTRFHKLFKVNVTVDPAELTFYYYNRDLNTDAITLNLGTFNGTVSNNLDNNLKNYVLVHGSGDSHRGLLSMKNLILEHENANVFLVDYGHYASMFYTIVVTCVPEVAAIMGEAVGKYLEVNNIPHNNLYIIGHSLGAHVSGGIGAALQGKANYIIGLDPASPLFLNEEPHKRLDASDAQYVQVLHTNGGFQGMMKAIGHADFYPNGGGMNQPGCGSDLFGSCAHARATAFYRESLKTGGFCARLCTSYEEYKDGDCALNQTSYFGTITPDKTAQGRYFFDTNAKSPYATGKC